MTTIATPTVFNTRHGPQTHAMNPYSLLTTRIAAIDASVLTRTTTAIELWQSTINNALAKVFGYALQPLEGCHPSPLSLNFCFILVGNSDRAAGEGKVEDHRESNGSVDT